MIVVTSLNPGHGKTSMVSNLGIAYAEVGKRVLMLDADVRNPRLHRIFGLSNEKGLLDVLKERNSPAKGTTDLPIQATYVPMLSLLSSGVLPTGISASSLFHSEAMLQLMNYLRRS